MEQDTAGDPQGGLKWTRRTTEKIAAQLERLGLGIGAMSVGRLLRDLGYSLRVNHKKRCSCSAQMRDEQFQYIAHLREVFSGKRRPIVSVDTKKRELVGNFKNQGVSWQRDPIVVNAYDFRSDAAGIAIPYGIYDVVAKRGSVFVGVSHDTPAFAVASLEKWWRQEGRKHYPSRKHLLVLADCGGSNGSRSRGWKHGLQSRLCDPHRLTVTVSHYPSGASKWNPVEHQLFNHISRNWSGRPLDSYETITNYLRTTATRTGLKVKAYLDRRTYPTATQISDDDMAKLRCDPHATLPQWNYTLSPRNG
jgi:hypothetical protein